MLIKNFIHCIYKKKSKEQHDSDDDTIYDIPDERISDIESDDEEQKEPNHRDLSPRSQKFADKFFLADDEKLISYHTCALKKIILLQGHMYLTDKKLCFFSPFNNKNLIFGKPTKLVIPYAQIDRIEKANVAGVIKNSIKVQTKSKKRIKFASFMKRNVVHDKLLDLISNLKDANDSYLDIIPDELTHKSDESSGDLQKNVSTKENSIVKSEANSCLYDSELVSILDSITIKNEAKIPLMNEYLKEDFLKNFKPLSEEEFDDVSLKEFYYKIYGDLKI